MNKLKKLSLQLKENEAALINSASNRLYFTDFASSAGFLIITKEDSWFFIDSRYYEKAKNTIKEINVILISNLYKQINSLLSEKEITTLLVETEYVSIDSYSNLSKRIPNIKISKSNTIQKFINNQRSIKSTYEIDRIKKAQLLTDDTFSYILNSIKPGVSEKEIMLNMEFYIRKHGSEGVSFDFIVVSGKNSSMPHGVPTDKKIENGDFVTMDFGAVIEGYRSDMTRTVAVGCVNDEQIHVYNTVLKAQKSAIEFIAPGIKCMDVDRKARDFISKEGYGNNFGHGLGHSVGIDIHEMPSFNTTCDTILEPGMVITVEPGIYLEGQFGVRIEDMIVVTKSGCTDITNSKKELIVL